MGAAGSACALAHSLRTPTLASPRPALSCPPAPRTPGSTVPPASAVMGLVVRVNWRGRRYLRLVEGVRAAPDGGGELELLLALGVSVKAAWVIVGGLFHAVPRCQPARVDGQGAAAHASSPRFLTAHARSLRCGQCRWPSSLAATLLMGRPTLQQPQRLASWRHTCACASVALRACPLLLRRAL